MNKKKCQVCGSSHTVKNGIRNGVQLYKCRDCGYQFRAAADAIGVALGSAMAVASYAAAALYFDVE